MLVARRCRLVRSRAHDWKSCNCHKQFEGSNPSISATRAGFLTCPFLMPKMPETPLNKGLTGCQQVRLEHLGFVLIGLLLGYFLELVGLLLGYQNHPVYAVSNGEQKIQLGYFLTKDKILCFYYPTITGDNPTPVIYCSATTMLSNSKRSNTSP